MNDQVFLFNLCSFYFFKTNKKSVYANYANLMPPAFPPTMQQLPPPPPPPPPHFHPNQAAPPPPVYPSQPQTLSAASSVNNNLNLLNQSGLLSDQPNQSMMNNLSFQSERTPFNQNRTLNLNGTMPSSASALNQNLKQQQQLQQQPPSTGSNVAFFNPSQPPPSIFSNAMPNATSMASKQQQQQILITSPPKQQTNLPLKFAPLQNTTSTPQQTTAAQFKPQAQQQQQQQQQAPANKPPVFQLSPGKPLTDATNLSGKSTATSLFGSNLFKTTATIATPEKQSTTNVVPAGSLFKAPQPTTLLSLNQEDAEETENDHG